MNTLPLPDFRDLRDARDLLDLIDRSRRPGAAPAGFLDCRGVLHRWDEEEA